MNSSDFNGATLQGLDSEAMMGKKQLKLPSMMSPMLSPRDDFVKISDEAGEVVESKEAVVERRTDNAAKE